jgi:hypothetical protein
MISAAFAIPGDIGLPTGGYMYDRRVLALLAQLGVAMRHLQLPGSFPDPSAADLDEAGRCSRRLRPATSSWSTDWPWRHAGRGHRARARANRCARCTIRCAWRRARQSAAGRAAYPGESSAGAGKAGRRHQLTRPGGRWSRFAVPADKGHGGRARHRSRAARTGSAAGPLKLLSVGAIVPRKAYDILVRALAP